jgi:hypothetical protein
VKDEGFVRRRLKGVAVSAIRQKLIKEDGWLCHNEPALQTKHWFYCLCEVFEFQRGEN